MKNRRLKLIVLENRNDDIRVIKNIINNSDLSFSLKVTNNKKSFKEYLLNFNPDVIISNYKLADFTGLEALTILNKTGFLIPFIFFTDPVNEQNAVKCLKAGAYDYILKKQSAKLIPAIKSSLKNKKRILSEIQSAGEIKRNEEMYRRFVKQNNEGIFRIETLIPVPIALNIEKQYSLVMKNSVIAECNEYLSKKMGFSKGSDLKGLDINIFTNLGSVAVLEKFEKFVKNGYKISNIITSEVNSKGLTKYFLSNYIGIIEDSNLIGIWGMYRDITELKKKENNLRNSEERIKLLFDNLLSGAFQVDVKGRIILANSSFVNLLGYNSNEDVIGRCVKYFDVNERKEILSQLTENNFIHKYETSWVKKDGSKIKVKLSANVVKNNDGKVILVEGIAENISDQKKYEDALIESEERFTAMADTAPVMIWIAGTDKLFFYFNKSWLQFTGGEIINELGNKWMKNIHPEDMKLFLNSYVSSFDSRTEFEIVIRLKRYDGKYRWILTRGIPRFLPDGSFTGYVGTAIDITDRKNAEDTLKESEELYKGVVQSLTEGLIITDISNKILFANVRMAEITGYSVDEMIGYYDYKLFFEPYQWNAVLEKNKKRFSGAEDRLEIKMHKKNGDEFWALINDSPYKDSKGKIIGSINTISDISKRKLAEKALRESEEKYRSVVQNVREVIFKTDQAGIITFLNPYWSEITGYELNKCIGRFLFDFIHPDDKKKSIKEFISIIYRKKDFCRFEMRIETNSGKQRWFLMNARITFDETTNIIGTYGTFNDIHDRIRTEEELRKAKDKAEESDNLKSHFLAQISHEIRSPLNIILGYNSLIKERLECETALNLNNEFNIIEASGRRLLRTIDLILNMSMVQTGSYDLVNEEFDINNLIENMLLEFTSMAETKNIELSYNNLCRSNKIFADRYTLTQAFQNLLDNAVKFTENGKVEIKRYENEKNIFVDIVDTGVGISYEYLSRLFEPFSQEEEGYSRRFEGNGLGLALTKKYIELNNGEITVNSQKGEGTTFTIKLNRELNPAG